MMLTATTYETRPVDEILENCRRLFEPAYRAAVATMPAEIARIAGYHIGWWDEIGRPTTLGGKAIRPAFAFTTAAAMSDGTLSRVQDRAALAAVAVELVHDFSLLHDDVMDRDYTRRHRASAWAQFGVARAILTGDLFMTIATDMLAANDVAAAQILTRALRALCRGQNSDLNFEQHQKVSIRQCMLMIEGKTAALLSAACELGAWASEASHTRMHLMRRFGMRVGVAYQMIDDLLGIWGDPQATGKSVSSDLMRRKQSLPVVAAMNSGTKAGDELARRYGDSRPIREFELAHLADLIETAGGRRWTERAACRNCEAAQQLLTEARPEPKAAADLLALTALITRRDR
ncbi:polyprenyl synthetase family protein [Nocardia vulneris]|uniref:polyprenyl synthetase family protein n=1 Tax=Nocardia vulneris TaxID=1141657 RepID=UPI0030D1AE2E